MEKYKVILREKINWLIESENILWLATMIIYILLFTKTCAQLVYGQESVYQVFRDKYFYSAASYFLVFILIERRVNLFSKPILITTITYVGMYFRHFAVNFYEPDYKADLQAQWVAWGLFLLVLADILRTGKRPAFSREHKVFGVVMTIAFMLALICDVTYSLPMVFPFLALYTTPISKKRWSQIMDCFTIGYYLSFAKIMTISLRQVPYEIKIHESSFKYYGVFLNTASAGIFCAGAFICILYWFAKVVMKERHVALGMFLCLLAMIYPLYATMLFASRAAELGIVFAILFSLIFLSTRTDHKYWIKRCIIVCVGGVIIMGLLLGAMYMVRQVDYETINAIPNEFVRTKVAYFRDVACRLMSMESSYSYFEDGTLLCGIDEASSYRLTTAVGGMQQVTTWGNGVMAFTVNDVFYMYPHNNYVTWLMMYGWVGGIPMIAWFLASFVTATKRVIKKDYTCLLTFLWTGFLLMLMLAETVLWIYVPAFVLLMVQYPLLVKQEQESEPGHVLGCVKIYGLIKCVIDRLLALIGLIILSPLFLLLIVATKLDSKGPILFRQKRVGIHKTHYQILKFRTMRIDTPKDTPTHLLENPEQYITGVGKFLRKSSLDELPQIINILKGDMAIIGPRPALWNQYDLIEERDKYGANDVLPGLTGWAQINGRDELSIDVKAKLDGEYTAKLTKGGFAAFAMDCRCFFGTILSVMKHDGVVEGGTGAMEGSKGATGKQEQNKQEKDKGNQ